MYEQFKDVKKLIVRKPKTEDPRPDNFVFRLHYQYTFSILAVACILVASYSYIDSSGSAIQCMTDKAQIPGDVLNHYCWISSTFTLPRHFEGKPGVDLIEHGVGPHDDEDEKIYHQYYQWVPIFLALQAAMFYLPHWIWKQLEGGKFDNIMLGLNKECDDSEKKIDTLVNYMKERKEYKFDHQIWALKLYFCELLNLVNVAVQMAITDRFLGYSFSQYGSEVLSWADQEPEDRVDPMSRVFPRITKCRFDKFGGSGTIQNFDALCVLGMNIINEKIFVFLWFWYVFLIIATCLNLVYRLVTWFIPGIRSRVVILENMGLRPKNDQQAGRIDKYLGDSSHSDWLIIYYMCQCMDKKNFYEFMDKMSNSGDTHDEDETDNSLNDVTARDDSTLLSKSRLKNMNFNFRRN